MKNMIFAFLFMIIFGVTSYLSFGAGFLALLLFILLSISIGIGWIKIIEKLDLHMQINNKNVNNGIFITNIIGIILYVIFAIAFLCFIYSVSERNKNKCPDVVTDTWTQVQYLVKKNLKSPSTADFPYPGKENLMFISKVDGKCSYFIAGDVDSQNGFGATVRSSYEVFVAYYIDSQKWEYIGFSLK